MADVVEIDEEALLTTLSNGVKIPIFGFGTAFGDWTSPDAGKAAFSPEDAWIAIPKACEEKHNNLLFFCFEIM